MGLDDDLIVQPGSIDESLRCPICMDVFDRPVHARGVCEHTFCLSCAERALRRRPNCPLCRATVQGHQLQPFLPMQRRVDEVSVHCSHHWCGCPWTGRLAARASHDKECAFTLAEDEHRGTATGSGGAAMVAALVAGNGLVGALAKCAKWAAEAVLILQVGLLGYEFYSKIRSFYKGEIDGYKCSENLTVVSASTSGSFAGAAIGAALIARAGPVELVLGAVAGSIAAGAATSWATRAAFQLMFGSDDRGSPS
eukprot:CAMPEP_0178441186 /NCGR_PEP_ID=MMETSP0689_2-20121128/37324_1 /TAXON_ID=160604 /ORGANISM="Amphidinium massartii, Strain CS-259" /LENGTH=252 /DNA_ID=CAMNT_0020064303 /DNA_START=16 /DNA_END=774 /DNA_ORIENTATION=+